MVKLSDITRRKLFVLVGPPSVGKSMWIRNTFRRMPYIVSRDYIVDKVVDERGMTYHDVFYDKDASSEVNRRLARRIENAKNVDNDVVVDMTNMNVSFRARSLDAFRDFEKIAVVFEFEGAESSLKRVAKKRAEEMERQGKNKNIPDSVFDSMFAAFERPTKQEGFDHIVSVDNRALLKKLAEGIDATCQAAPVDTVRFAPPRGWSKSASKVRWLGKRFKWQARNGVTTMNEGKNKVTDKIIKKEKDEGVDEKKASFNRSFIHYEETNEKWIPFGKTTGVIWILDAFTPPAERNRGQMREIVKFLKEKTKKIMWGEFTPMGERFLKRYEMSEEKEKTYEVV